MFSWHVFAREFKIFVICQASGLKMLVEESTSNRGRAKNTFAADYSRSPRELRRKSLDIDSSKPYSSAQNPHTLLQSIPAGSLICA